ncbi:8-oxo-dGTP pyrophosphatase MutT (NUDIX family) [Rhodovulum imhoffii]|uniref:8-oxo-dGTP pyrophosphatase MutT (NUDIX family) n=1 Tax=Rhodovulum imhoffii TaxID=365340 RepID=A0A2T5BRJ0_9RHOB|nr:CoA pyrophosphatase [Rhodovulum imhoffii]MBK5934013.1 CoA pyrophosphatase [Rhodovulum imhoffii]PTN01898.1 8-oxo-dGTP pyrophosphatase MutT (NUDIX family) [Rhodovulum imhoffii]
MGTHDPVAALRAALARTGGETSDHDLNPDFPRLPGRVLRPAAVLVAVKRGPAGLHVVLTKRSSRLRHHPGQIAFPGGKLDAGDAGPVAAALREAQEEIALPPENVEILGLLPCHETVTGFTVTPVLGVLRGPFTPVPEAGEVEEIFDVPFTHLVQPGNFRVQARRWRGDWRFYYTVPFGPYYIWGATARILRALADRVAP